MLSVSYNPYADSKTDSYTVQLHCHTDQSEGVDTPTAIVTAYKDAGYDAVAICDHNMITADPGVAGITNIPGCEESATGHMGNLWLTARETSASDQVIINTITGQGGLCIFYHPDYVTAPWTYAVMSALENINLIEVYNFLTKEIAEEKWDLLLTAGHKYYGIATDDCHDISRSDRFNGGWVVIHADTIDGLKASLSAGNFYATQGPSVAVTVEGTTVKATTGAAAKIEFIVSGGVVAKTATGSTSSDYDVQPNDDYVRVKITRDSDSKMAWSQPIFWDEIKRWTGLPSMCECFPS